MEGKLRSNGMPHKGFADPVTSDETRFRPNMPVSELTEHVTRTTEASNVNSTPPVAEIIDGETHKTRSTPTEPNGARGLEPPDPNSGIRLTEVRRPAREGLKATLHRTGPREKM